MVHALRLFFAILFLTPLLYGQFASGIQGTTLDSAGAVIPGLRVVVTDLSTRVTREASSSEVGVYRILSLSAGANTVTYPGSHKDTGYSPRSGGCCRTLQARKLPSLDKEGWTRHQKMPR